jgi:hypothetical protein
MRLTAAYGQPSALEIVVEMLQKHWAELDKLA